MKRCSSCKNYCNYNCFIKNEPILLPLNQGYQCKYYEKNDKPFITAKVYDDKKTLNLLKEYEVDIWLLKQCDYENYIRIRKECHIEVEKIKNEDGLIVDFVIPAEDFYYLKEVLE